MPPSILSLPRELRDVIVDIVLMSTVSAPKKPEVYERRKVHANRVEEKEGVKEEFITTSLPLLLVNKQFYAEVKEAIGRFLDEDQQQHNKLESGTGRKRRELNYKFDIMLVDDTYVWPARVCVPFLARQVDNVDVTIQAFGTAPVTKRTLSGVNAFKSDLGPTEIHWSFFYPLNYLLKHGPRWDMWTERRSRWHAGKKGDVHPAGQSEGIAIDVLTLDFQTSTDNIATEDIFQEWVDAGVGFLFEQWKLCRGRPSQQEGWENVHKIVARPPWMQRYLVARLVYMLCMDYHTAEYGAILYEKVGKIRIMLNGDLQREIHLAETLASLRYNDPMHTFGHLRREDRLDAFWKWKKEALQMRKERGFPVMYGNDPELEDHSPPAEIPV
ncbi:hypothetical protein FQN49_000484 [Arthroderma sp. PD_2]|nr:hypothetical protein FQN49_000484 [Arthroderma sp. PD_2]